MWEIIFTFLYSLWIILIHLSTSSWWFVVVLRMERSMFLLGLGLKFRVFGLRGLFAWLGFWLKVGVGLRVFISSFIYFIFFSNWEIASRFLTLWRIPVASCCAQRNVLNSKKLLRPSLLLEFTQDSPLPFREWTMYGCFFSSLSRKRLWAVSELFWQLVRNSPAGGWRYEHRNKLQLVSSFF